MSNIRFNKDFTIAYISKEFKNKMYEFGTPEYEQMRQLRATYPSISVRVRSAVSSHNYNLTYANMEAYIRTKPNAEALLNEFKRIREESVIQRNRHLYVVGWFKEMFPDYAEAQLFQKAEAKEPLAFPSEETDKIPA